MNTNKSGRTTEGCYAAPLGDCDGGPLTREHYVSSNLIERLGGRVRVGGLAWLKEPRELTVKALSSKILCARHNNALSPLDTAAGTLLNAIIDGCLQAGPTRRGMHAVAIEGDLLERWLYKVLAGLLFSRNAILPGYSQMVPESRIVEYIFCGGALPDKVGLHLYAPRNAVTMTDPPALQITTHVGSPRDSCPGEISGLSVGLFGVEWLASLMPPRVSPDYGDLHYRPKGLIINEHVSIRLRWRQGPKSGRFSIKMDPSRHTGS